jgi:hypothetical protein
VLRRSRRPLVLAILAVAAVGCGRKPSDPVRELIDEIADAAEDRDADRVAARLSEAFRGQETIPRADMAASLRRYFAAYESIDVEVFDLEVTPGDGMARVRTRVGFTGQANRAFGLGGLLPPSAVYRFDVEARDEGGVWRVTRASWEQAAAPGASGGS